MHGQVEFGHPPQTQVATNWTEIVCHMMFPQIEGALRQILTE